MGIRIAFSCAALSICGMATWLSPFPRSGPGLVAAPSQNARNAAAQERTEGSALPCAAPLAWRVARVDGEFGIGRDQARAAVQEAAWIWEEATGQALFRHDSIEGFPIRIVYDGRQARALDRRRREMALDSTVQILTVARDELTLRGEELSQEKTRLDAQVHDLNRRVAEHNAVVSRWNRRGGAPEARAREIAAAGEEFRVERTELENEAERLEREVRSLDSDRNRLDHRIREHTRRAQDFAEAFPPARAEWGVYREAVHEGGGGEIVSVSREIRIYRFEDRSDLVAVAAHELGHALGLDHNAATGAVMSGERVSQGSLGPTELDATDVEALAVTCPDLVPDHDPEG